MGLKYKVKDLNLAPEGRLQIQWAEAHMPVLMKIRERFEREKPMKGVQVGATLHVTKETAVLVRTLKAGGADVALCGSNPLSTKDGVASALVEDGIDVYAWRGQSSEDYYWCINRVLDYAPEIVHDDGADMICTIHDKRMDLAGGVVVAQEETTTGVIRLKAMERQGVLRFPVIAVNDARTKRLFDNRYGTGQSTIDGILRATSVLIAGKIVVVSGYGWCGRGIARRARGMGANVVVTEIDPVKALEAVMDGFGVMPMTEAAKIGDIFVTSTGCTKVIRGEHMAMMKGGAILANAGHFNVEISIPDLEARSIDKRVVRPNVEEYTMKGGGRLYLLGEGRLVNLVSAEGHPPDVMDMSFANQALCAEYAVQRKTEFETKVYDVPGEIDHSVARVKLETMGVSIDTPTKEQEEYLQGWRLGT
ncbi:MAG: adenosylhomocysteinase [Candidatus Bathyarchaeia archaeon]